MPIYEFYCPDCHTVFNFLSRKPGVRRRPDCPGCGRKRLRRKPSSFAISKGLERSGEEPLPEFDEAGLERAMASLASELEGVDENDPKMAAQMMRRLHEAAGIDLGPGVEEAIRRMEAGEDPDRIEEEMGELLEAGGIAAGDTGRSLRGLRRRFLPPSVDETLHEL